MKAAIVRTLGQAPIIGTFDEPAPLAGEVKVRVAAAGIKQLDRAIVAGRHYSSPKSLPIIPGTDGVGYLADGSRVYFASFRQPYGAMAQSSVASLTVPVPDGVDDATAAALINPALAAWLPLFWRANMQAGETVLIIGATGTSGKLAVQAARFAGAGRIVAAGRKQAVLDQLGADATVNLTLPHAELSQAFAAAAGENGYQVIVDYIWGEATEALIDVLGNHDLASHSDGVSRGIRLVNVGSMAAPTIALPAALLRSADVHILGSGTGNFPPAEQLKQTIGDILQMAAQKRITLDVQTHAFDDIHDVWDINKQSELRSVMIIG